MKTAHYCIVFMSLLFLTCNNPQSRTRKEIRNETITNVPFGTEDTLSSKSELPYPGVVIIRYLQMAIQNEGAILIRNEEDMVADRIFFHDNTEMRIGFERETPSIRGYYPNELDLIIFDGYPVENGMYKILINDTIFFLDNMVKYIHFEKWDEHITTTLVSTNELNPLRETPTESGKIVPLEGWEHFVVLEVENDWIKVVCNEACGGCPAEKLVTGWLRWRKGAELLVELYYSC